MSKLDPRPETHKPLRSWDYLNRTLQANLSHADPEKRFLVIDLRDYEISKEEIVAEATNQGYKVSTESDPNYLKFK